eukprot:7468730-Prorocentrum_lima.AAC.1
MEAGTQTVVDITQEASIQTEADTDERSEDAGDLTSILDKVAELNEKHDQLERIRDNLQRDMDLL